MGIQGRQRALSPSLALAGIVLSGFFPLTAYAGAATISGPDPDTPPASPARPGDAAGDAPANAAGKAETRRDGSDSARAIALPRMRIRGDALPAVPQAGSVLSRKDILRVSPTEPYMILTGLPGVYFQNDGSPSLAISIRGMQDFGRVNVMIDGARQNFQTSGHGANGSVFVDPALLSGLEVERGTVATGDGAGAIAGVVNLHTLGVDDMVEQGKRYGVTARALGGSNNYDGSGMIGAGAHLRRWLSVAAAFSMRSSGDYADGEGNRIPNTYQRLQSGLFKIGIVPGADQSLTLGTVIYHNAFGQGTANVPTSNTIGNNQGSVEYRYTPRGSALLSLHVKGYVVSEGMSNFTPSFRAQTVAAANLTHYGLTTLGFEADNASRFSVGPVRARLDYGGEYYHDAVATRDQTGYDGATPSGTRAIGSAFSQLALNWRIVQLTGALRYDTYRLTGSGVNEAGGFTSAGAGAFAARNSADAVNPKVTLAVSPVRGLQLYGSYGLGFRPPSTTETLMAGSHPGLGFLKFIPNPALAPERTFGWEAGARLRYRDVLRDSDRITFDGDYFDTRIKNYIAQTMVVGRPSPGSFIPNYGYFYQNTSGNSFTHGFEGKLGYESSLVFGSLSYTNTTTELGAPDYRGYGAFLTTPPRSVLASTLGIHLLENRLTLGARVRAATRTLGQPSRLGGAYPRQSGYVVFDMFGAYQLSRQLRLFVNADNITDRRYFVSQISSIPNQGLTVMGGLTFALSR